MPTGNPTSKGEKCISNRGILHPQITAEPGTMIHSLRTYFFFFQGVVHKILKQNIGRPETAQTA